MRIFIGIIVAISFTFYSFSLGDVPKKAEKMLQKSKASFDTQAYKEAKEYALKAIKIYPKYIKAYAQLAKIHTHLKEFDEAAKAYEKILQIDSSPINQFKTNYKLGQLHFDQQKYTSSIQYLKKCLAVESIGKNWQRIKDKADWMLKNAQFAEHALKNPVPFKPVRLDSTINTQHDEYLPTVTADEETIIFTRRFNGTSSSSEDFYYSRQDTTSEGWQTAVSLEEVNSAKNEGAIAISPDGRRMFFAAKGRKGMGSFDIYYCIRRGDSWEGPYELGPPVNTRHWDSQPSISADGKSLYFASRRKGGLGGIDLWVSNLVKNYWTKPINLGEAINTPGDEQSPFIHPDNQTLYFSSNGHLGMGDTDLYVARKDKDGNWQKAENLGYPINTSGNENGLIVTADGARAYYSSFTEENGLDLYYFELPKKAKPVYVTYIKGVVSDIDTGKKLDATIRLIDLESGKTLHRTVSDKANGKFLVTLPVGKNYMYNVSKRGYLFHSENFSLQEHNPEEPYLIDIQLTPLLAPVLAPLASKMIDAKDFEDKPEIEAKKEEVKRTLTVIPEDEEDKELALVKDEPKEEPKKLVPLKNEITPEKEVSAPIPVVEEKPEPVPPPPAPKPIVKEVPKPAPPPPPAPKPIVKETPKPAPPPPAPKPVVKEAPKPAPPPPAPKPVVKEAPKPAPPKPKPIVKPAPKPVVKKDTDYKWNVGKSVVLKNVFFETNSFELKSISYTELNQLVGLLRSYPDLRVEIGGHTDDVGKESYNQNLSMKRARSVYNYLVSKGISANQLSYKGYGELLPIATNKTAEGRAQNRRTEFKIIDSQGRNTGTNQITLPK